VQALARKEDAVEYTIRITPQGEVQCLYEEGNPIFEMPELGRKKIVRASDVRFDEDEQKWFVYVQTPKGTEKRLSDGFEKRSEAIQWEIEHLNAVLTELPATVDALFRQ